MPKEDFLDLYLAKYRIAFCCFYVNLIEKKRGRNRKVKSLGKVSIFDKQLSEKRELLIIIKHNKICLD